LVKNHVIEIHKNNYFQINSPSQILNENGFFDKLVRNRGTDSALHTRSSAVLLSEAGATFDNSFFDNSFGFLRQFKNGSFLDPVFVHVTAPAALLSALSTMDLLSSTILRNAIVLRLLLLVDAMVLARYLLIFWLKNPLKFQDDFWCHFVNTWVIVCRFLLNTFFSFLEFYNLGSIFWGFHLISEGLC
jgi:hypothetical protein